nr:carbamoyltransferase HypF [uncultured Dethiosulfovibrio sp.]
MIERHIIVTGVVQAVGFRPFCAKLASRWNLGGSVSNTSEGVRLVLRGSRDTIDNYIRDLYISKPDLAEIHTLEMLDEFDCEKKGPFVIGPTIKGTGQRVLLPPDIATCSNCVQEMDNLGDRRYRYPFINCTDCGPRFSIVKGLPYDRPQTTMESFPMCPHCTEEYGDQNDRRFHAQPNGCPDCGPRIWSHKEGSEDLYDQEGLEKCRQGLRSGEIWAIKGLGGFHLACDPNCHRTLERLREAKRRPQKPFALMVENLDAAASIACLEEVGKRLLESTRRPIVLCPIRGDIPPLIAPNQDRVGIMLPYTPLHRLIMEGMVALVMTSGNLANSPLISENQEALSKLGNIVDGFLLHDRDIHMKIDDSLVAPCGDKSVIMRRARGYVPNPVHTSCKMPQILAAGGEMKSTFSLTRDNLIFPSQYLGDGKEMATLEYYKKTLKHFMGLYEIAPKVIAHDLHPLYMTTRVAKEVAGEDLPSMAIQHHHAHLAACLAEHHRNEPTIGVILDGTGYGTDGTIWGGEFLLGDLSEFSRVGHLMTCPLPGGDRSVKEPWRYSLSLLVQALGEDKALSRARELWSDREKTIELILKALGGAPVTSSCGRLFDGIWGLLAIGETVTYDGQGAGELEAKSGSSGKEIPMDIVGSGKDFIVDWRPFIRWIAEERPSVERGSSSFHLSLSRAITESCMRVREAHGIDTVALSGGVWQNCRLLRQTVASLENEGFSVLTHEKTSPNDESISIGQAAIAGWRWKKEEA